MVYVDDVLCIERKCQSIRFFVWFWSQYNPLLKFERQFIRKSSVMILISNQYGWISINAKDFEGVCDKVSSFGVTEVKRIENQCYDIIFITFLCVVS